MRYSKWNQKTVGVWKFSKRADLSYGQDTEKNKAFVGDAKQISLTEVCFFVEEWAKG